MSWQPYAARPESTVTGTLVQWPGVGDAAHAPRTLLAWLPPSYAAQPQRRYPVVYFHDGQNVFDAATSFSGEWGADETLTALAGEGLEAIAVGIPNGGERRFHEYSPVRSSALPDLGGGGADAYVAFLAGVVKPLVDASLPTRPEPEHTVVIGSSMGGVVSLHALLTRPDVFGHAGVMSPAFWTGGRAPLVSPAPRPGPRVGSGLTSAGRRATIPGGSASTGTRPTPSPR